ncbi:hypothetical protein ACN47E_005788 [Coniothyrium glycines]
MSAARAATKKKNLLLCLDAFGTLYTPSTPIPAAYAQVAARYGINCGADGAGAVRTSFKKAFKAQSEQNPNYGKATGLGAEKWWGNVIHQTFTPFLESNQEVPQALVSDLLKRYSTNEGYTLYDDVDPFFRALKNPLFRLRYNSITWNRVIVGIISNSDDRVPGVLESFGLKIGSRRFGVTDCHGKQTLPQEEDVDFVVMSYDVGFEKPDHRIFDAAVGMLESSLKDHGEDLTPDDFEKLYVGDEVKKDYEAAKAAGWHSLWLDRDRKAETDNIVNGEDVIHSLLEITNVRAIR